MNLDFLISNLLKLIYILSFLIGFLLILYAIICPSKLIIGTTNKIKVYYFKRVLFIIVGVLMILTPSLYFLNIITKSDCAIIFAVTAVISQCINFTKYQIQTK